MNKKKKVVLIGHLYEQDPQQLQNVKKHAAKERIKTKEPKIDMGKFLLSIPKDLRREIKFESDERGFGNVSAYICHILKKREAIFVVKEDE